MNKHTKKALLASVLSLILCVSMLIGTTFAWFTDSVTAGVNVIKSGTLDIDLEYSKTMADNSWKNAEGAIDVLNPNALWEPGHTEVVYLRITNKGDLALKYQFMMNIVDTVIGKSVLGNDINLAEYLKYDIVDATAAFTNRAAALDAVEQENNLVGETVSGEMTTKDETKTLALIVYMPETIGNEANYREVAPSIKLTFTLFATQQTSESDSFNNQYDKLASIDTEEELKEALEAGYNNITLTSDITFTSENAIKNDVLIDLNGHTVTGPAATVRNGRIFQITEGNSLTIKNGKISSNGYAIVSGGNGSEVNTVVLENVEMSTTTVGVYHNGNAYGVNVVIKDSKIVCSESSSTAVFLSGSKAWGTKKSSLSVENSTLEGGNAIEVKYCDVSVKSSTLKATTTASALRTGVSGGCAEGYALALTNNGSDEDSFGIITIEDTTIKGGIGIKARGEARVLTASEYTDTARLTLIVSNAAEFKNILTTGGNVVLAADLTVDTAVEIPAGVTSILDLNGKIVSNPNGYAIKNNGTLTISGDGVVEGKQYALRSEGMLTLAGGSYKGSNGAVFNWGNWEDVVIDGDVHDSEFYNVTVKDGNIKNCAFDSFKVAGGTLENCTFTRNGTYAGGTFEFAPPASNLEPYHYVADNGNGTWTVAPDYQAYIGETGYLTFYDVLNDVKDGETIVVARDIEFLGGYEIYNKNITIDLDGHTLSVKGNYPPTNGYVFKVTGTSNVTFKNGTMTGPNGAVTTDGTATFTIQ